MLISKLPREKLATLPTPLEPMPRFTESLGGADLWIKRDDLTGLGLGGNKARKLEFLVADALASGCDALITTGGVQSNHARMTAAAAARMGMECSLVLTGEEPGEPYPGNLLLDALFGATPIFCGAEGDAGEAMAAEADRMRDRGLSPYLVPLGGSVPIGSVGYVLAGFELIGQAVDRGLTFEHVFLASGSAGTAAGMALGLATMEAPVTLHTVSVSRSEDELRTMTLDLAAETARFLGWKADGVDRILRVHDGYVGDGYAIPTREGIEAIRLLAAREGIITDPTYTGKALAALVDKVRCGDIPAGDRAIFLHTGGFPANFANPEVLLGDWESGEAGCT